MISTPPIMKGNTSPQPQDKSRPNPTLPTVRLGQHVSQQKHYSLTKDSKHQFQSSFPRILLLIKLNLHSETQHSICLIQYYLKKFVSQLTNNIYHKLLEHVSQITKQSSKITFRHVPSFFFHCQKVPLPHLVKSKITM